MWPRPTSRFWQRLFASTRPLQEFLVKAIPSLRALQNTLFSPGDYYYRYPDLQKSGLIPAFDYVLFGASEGKDPHRLFDTKFYLEQVPALRRSHRNPALHYLQRGVRARYDPHPLFSTSYYLDSNPDVLQSRTNPLHHFLHSGSSEGRKPSPLFDIQDYKAQGQGANDISIDALSHYLMNWATSDFEPCPFFDTAFYLETNPDVDRNHVNPLYHYCRFGYAEHRDPHPLFDTSYYLTKHPDLPKSGFNPLAHFALFGNQENRKTHPLFEPEFYLFTQPQLRRTRTPALSHFLAEGIQRALPPSARFDPLYYNRLYPDVESSGFDPFTHYLRFGQAESRSIRSPRFETGAGENFFPAASFPKAPVRAVTVDIIVPVYKGFEETRVCLESVVAARSRNRAASHLVLINDCSPDTELSAYLRRFAGVHGAELIEHSANLGFVLTANEGMALHPGRDKVLLNNDTEVFGNWIDRLAHHAYSGRIGTVTPFSNNATICSYPRFCAVNPDLPSADTAELDDLTSRVNAGRHCRIPTGVGFCMYIRRDCLDEIGPFDVASFPRGYGEENDFCMRAMQHGWEHLLAADTFVFHKGGTSFGADTSLQERALKAVLKKHPRYLEYLEWHAGTDPANAFRIAATTERIRQLKTPVWLSVLHRHSGGTEEHVDHLEADTNGKVFWLRLYPAEDSHVQLSCVAPGYEFSVALHSKVDYALMLRLLESVNVRRIHIHHLMDVAVDVHKLASDLDVPYDLTVHDYFLVCPRITLTDKAGRYCGERPCRDAAGCDKATRQGRHGANVQSWRAKNERLFADASRVIAPSEDAATRIQSYFPSIEVTAAWHEEKSSRVAAMPVAAHEKLRIAVLGNMNLHKGFANLRAVSDLASMGGSPLDFRLIGSVFSEFSSENLNFSSTGKYTHSELPCLLSTYLPHIVWFPCQWPETFSYTLSTCLEFGFPVAAPDLGAFPERLSRREWTWVLPWQTSPEAWLSFFLEIRQNHFVPGVAPSPSPQRVRTAQVDFYPEFYLRAALRQLSLQSI